MIRPLAAQRLRWRTLPPRALAPDGRLLRGPLRSPRLLADPAGRYTIRWASPADRLLEVQVTCHRPGAWLGLHFPFRPRPRAGGLGFAVHLEISPPATLQAVLRLPQRGGFQDIPFPRPLLGLPQGTQDAGAIFARLPATRWHEWILFLPPGRDFAFALHDIRLSPL